MTSHDHPIQHAVEQASGPATYFGASLTALWGLTADQWTAIGVLIGVIFTAASFAVNWVYQHKRLQETKRYHDKKSTQ